MLKVLEGILPVKSKVVGQNRGCRHSHKVQFLFEVVIGVNLPENINGFQVLELFV